MFKFYDWRDFGTPAEDLLAVGSNYAVTFESLDVDVQKVFSPDIFVNGEPNPVLFEDAFHF